jgi:outer membrane lipoprotein-sorting protein
MKRILKWLPALVAPVVVAGAVAAPAFAAGTAGSQASAAHASTPSASQVIALIAKAKNAHYSGTIEQTSDLGLPELPSGALGGTSSSDAQTSGILELLTTPHKARIYVDGATKQRLQVLDSLAERDLVRNGTDVWSWNSKTDKAVHVTLPSKTAPMDGTSSTPTATPQSLADQLVKKAGIDSTLTVSKGSVASRSVWRLTITPKTSQTLVGKAILSVDTKTGVPLAAEIDARGQKSAAGAVTFSSVDFGTPAASNFTFTPPKGAKVTHTTLPSHTAKPDNRRPGSFEGPTVIGSGWTSILALPAGALGSGTSGLTSSQSHTLTQLTQSVHGGRGLQTSLFSVLLTDDGRLFAGAVPLSALESAAG